MCLPLMALRCRFVRSPRPSLDRVGQAGYARSVVVFETEKARTGLRRYLSCLRDCPVRAPKCLGRQLSTLLCCNTGSRNPEDGLCTYSCSWAFGIEGTESTGSASRCSRCSLFSDELVRSVVARFDERLRCRLRPFPTRITNKVQSSHITASSVFCLGLQGPQSMLEGF